MSVMERIEAVDRFIRLKDVLLIVPLKRSTIYSRMSRGEFPQARDLGGGVVAWIESEVREWMASRPVNPIVGSNIHQGVSVGVSAASRG